jgi:photosystem II stability/assembly factor-like uncharacterized protein
MKFKRLAPLFAGVFLILACRFLTFVTPTPTLVPSTDTPPETVPATIEPSTVTMTPSLPEPQTATAVPPVGPPITHLSAGQAIKLTYIHMLNLMNGWAIGGQNGASNHVFRTSDGGLTWQDLTPPEPASADPSQPQKAVGTFLDDLHGWVVYSNLGPIARSTAYVWFTHDGGATWQYSGLTEPALYQEFFLPEAPFFLDPQHGWLLVHVGAGMNHDYYVLLGSNDGGQTWETLVSPMNDLSGTQSCSKTGLVFATTQNGWMPTDCRGVAPVPYLFKTQDGGATWDKVGLPAPAGTTDLFNQWYCGLHSPLLFTDQAGDFVLKCDQFDNGQKISQYYLYQTKDNGLSWTTYPYPGGDLKFIGQMAAFALGRDIQRSEDAGHTWTKVKTVSWDGQFSFVDANNIWAVARDGDQIALVKSVDGALTWQEIKPKVGP